jgi:hypothetical protein
MRGNPNVSDLEFWWIILGAICAAAMCGVWNISLTRVHVAFGSKDRWEQLRSVQLFVEKSLYLILQLLFLWIGFIAAGAPPPILAENANASRLTGIVAITFQLTRTLYSVWATWVYHRLLDPELLGTSTRLAPRRERTD